MSKKVRFTKRFDFSPKAFNGLVTKEFKEGAEETLTEEEYAAAMEAGVIEEASGSRRKAEDDAGGKSR